MPSAGGSAGSSWEKYRAIDIDFHQTLSNALKSPLLGTANPGMLELVQAVLNEDPRNKIIISCGGIGDYGEKLKAAYRMWLRRQGLDPSRFDFEDKPRTVAVIDDHALQYNGHNAPELTREVLRRLRNLETQGPDILSPAGGSANGRPQLAPR